MTLRLHNLASARVNAAIHQRGFSMTEILVAVFIFAFGGIGASAMQVLAAQWNLDALQQSEAVYHATDILERIRNNSAESFAIYDPPGDTAWTIIGGGSIETEPTPDCDTASCTPEQQATHDLWAWQRALDGHSITRPPDDTPAGGLVHPTGCIRNDGNGAFEVAVAWYGRREMTNASVAPGCIVDGRYGEDGQFRRVLRLRTHIQP